MKTFKFWVWSLLLAFIMSTQALAGAWTANEFVYKPALGARGAEEKARFDSGADRLDARLGKEIWVGDPKYGSTLQAAVTAIGSSQVVLRVPAGTHNIAADLTIPANVTLKPERGAVLAIATAKTLTVNGGLGAGPYQIFSCVGTGKVVLKNQTLYPEWWGAVPSTDKTSASQSTYIDQAVVSLLASTNCTLDFGSSSWIIDSPIWVASTSGKSGFTIRGDGATMAVKTGTVYTVTGLGTSKPLAYSNVTNRQFSILEIINCSDFSVDGLILDGNYGGRGASTLAQSAGINLNGCHRFSISNVQAHHCQGDGLMLAAMANSSFTGYGTVASNCSEFNISNLILHDLARDGISVVGARNGNISNIVTYNIGSDANNYGVSGPWHSIQFEVDPSEAAYEMVAKINVVNIFGYANRVNGGFIGISYLAKDINISNFWFTDVNISTTSHNMLMVGYNNTGIKLANGRLYKENAQAAPNYTYGIYVQSGTGSLSTVEMNNVTIVGATIGIRHDINTRLNLQNCSIEDFLRFAVEGYGELIAQGNTIRYTGTGTPSPYAFSLQEVGIKEIKNNYIVTTNSDFYATGISSSATKVFFDNNIIIGATIGINSISGAPLSFTGNNFRGLAGLTGSFTMAAANTKTVNNVNITPYSKIFLFPTNAAAATLMSGVSALYVDPTATVNYSSFTVKTADGGNAAGSETFGYLIY